jgi:hypothetical protein
MRKCEGGGKAGLEDGEIGRSGRGNVGKKEVGKVGKSKTERLRDWGISVFFFGFCAQTSAYF